MKELTDKERLKLYKLTLKNFEEYDGLCSMLNENMQIMFPEFAEFLQEYYEGDKDEEGNLKEILIPDPYHHMNQFPEIYKRKPVDAGGYWFPLSDSDSRRKILMEAINELTKKV